VVSYFLRYFSSTSTEQIFSDSAGPFTSFDPVGFAIFAKIPQRHYGAAFPSAVDHMGRLPGFGHSISRRSLDKVPSSSDTLQ
jgi:hypothetical protein